MILYLVRHGETRYNRDGLALGRADVPLSDLGLRQAVAVAHELRDSGLTRVVSSPLSRALHVAASLADTCAAELVVDERLSELDVGETEGLEFAEVRRRYPGFLERWIGPEGHAIQMPGGESLLDVHGRVKDLLDELRQSAEARVALVSHNFVLRLLVCELLALPPSAFRRIQMDLASITTVEWDGSRTAVRKLNDRCHLSSLEP